MHQNCLAINNWTLKVANVLICSANGVMSKQKSKNNLEKKKSYLEMVLAVIGVIVSAVALYFSWRANLIAKEANRIAEEQQRPRVSVSHQFTFQRWADEHHDPCFVSADEIRWDTEFVVAFDITNSGGAPISLTKVDFSPRLDVTTSLPTVTAYAWLSYFNSREELRQWYSEKQGPSETQLLPSIE